MREGILASAARCILSIYLCAFCLTLRFCLITAWASLLVLVWERALTVCGALGASTVTMADFIPATGARRKLAIFNFMTRRDLHANFDLSARRIRLVRASWAVIVCLVVIHDRALRTIGTCFAATSLAFIRGGAHWALGWLGSRVEALVASWALCAGLLATQGELAVAAGLRACTGGGASVARRAYLAGIHASLISEESSWTGQSRTTYEASTIDRAKAAFWAVRTLLRRRVPVGTSAALDRLLLCGDPGVASRDSALICGVGWGPSFIA